MMDQAIQGKLMMNCFVLVGLAEFTCRSVLLRVFLF